MTLLDLAKKRRSCYALKNQIPLTQPQLLCLVREAVKQAPSAFNSQSARVMVLLGEKHHLFWQLVTQALQKMVPAENWNKTAEKINAFDRAFGTLLFFEDWSAVIKLQAEFPAYEERFVLWAYQSNGMLEYLIWLALAEQNIGASLQHYNPLVDRAVAQHFGVPSSWRLVAQMPFGAVEQAPQKKEFLPLAPRVRVEK